MRSLRSCNQWPWGLRPWAYDALPLIFTEAFACRLGTLRIGEAYAVVRIEAYAPIRPAFVFEARYNTRPKAVQAWPKAVHISFAHITGSCVLGRRLAYARDRSPRTR